MSRTSLGRASLFVVALAAGGCGADGGNDAPSGAAEDASAGGDVASEGVDAAADPSPDLASEVSPDAASDVAADAPAEGSTEAAPDAVADAPAESEPDADAAPNCWDPTGPLVLSTELAANGSLWDETSQAGGSIAYGVANANARDGVVASLRFPGSTTLLSSDHVGPAWATQIASHATVGYGTYRAGVWLAACSPGESVVNGYFLYANDGIDHDGNGIIDNVEIDIEIVCDAPNIILLTAWTDYTDDTSFRKWSRAIDTSTGEWLESPNDHEYGLVHGGDDSAFLHPTFPAPAVFYDMGFRWTDGGLCFFAVLDGQPIVLWDLADAPARLAYVPKWRAVNAPQLMFNVWHPSAHWYANGPASYPASDAIMQIDFAQYWAP